MDQAGGFELGQPGEHVAHRAEHGNNGPHPRSGGGGEMSSVAPGLTPTLPAWEVLSRSLSLPGRRSCFSRPSAWGRVLLRDARRAGLMEPARGIPCQMAACIRHPSRVALGGSPRAMHLQRLAAQTMAA